MSTYTGYFRDLNEKLYTVKITTSEGSENKEITLGTDPFVTEMETSDSHLYKPCKYETATVRIVADNYMFDLYSSTAQQNKVTLFDEENNVVWIGYITPNIYSQGYSFETEELEIEVINALSTLQYYKYVPVSGTKEIVTFKQIIDSLLTKCNAYSEYYISNAIQLFSTESSLLENLYISEQNFFDEDDEAMTMQEVLEEICRYLNFTCVADGDKLYFIDYDAVKSGINTYYKYSLINVSDNPTLVTLSNSHTISGESYAETGQQISMDNVYNKVSVKDSLYSFDEIIPNVWDENSLENYGGSYNYTQEVNEELGNKYRCLFKYYKNPNYKCYYYTKDLESVELTNVNYETTQNYVGATIVKHYCEKVNDYTDDFSKVDFTDYILLHCHDTQNNMQRPLFQLEYNNYLPSFLPTNSYIILNGTVRFMDRAGKMFVPTEYSDDDDDFLDVNLRLACKLQMGRYTWGGDKWYLDSDGHVFYIFLESDGQNKHFLNKDFDFKSNITYSYGLGDESGYAIPLPPAWNGLTIEKPVFKIYQPSRVNSDYRCDAVWISDFEMKIKISNIDKDYSDSEDETDTEYYNIINEDFVNEMDEEEFKICTWDNKEVNYSAVSFQKNNDKLYLDKTTNRATQQELRQEEHLIYKLVNQYSTPSAILELDLKHSLIKPYSTLTDKYLDGKIFIVDSISTNYANASDEVKLIEKK